LRLTLRKGWRRPVTRSMASTIFLASSSVRGGIDWTILKTSAAFLDLKTRPLAIVPSSYLKLGRPATAPTWPRQPGRGPPRPGGLAPRAPLGRRSIPTRVRPTPDDLPGHGALPRPRLAHDEEPEGLPTAHRETPASGNCSRERSAYFPLS